MTGNAYMISKNRMMGIALIFYICLLIWYSTTTRNDIFSSKKGDNGRLVWMRNNNINYFSDPVAISYLLGLFIPYFFMNLKIVYPLMLTGVITYIFSSYISNEGFGSFWCYTAVIYSLVCLFI